VRRQSYSTDILFSDYTLSTGCSVWWCRGQFNYLSAFQGASSSLLQGYWGLFTAKFALCLVLYYLSLTPPFICLQQDAKAHKHPDMLVMRKPFLCLIVFFTFKLPLLGHYARSLTSCDWDSFIIIAVSDMCLLNCSVWSRHHPLVYWTIFLDDVHRKGYRWLITHFGTVQQQYTIYGQVAALYSHLEVCRLSRY
jgi:hypothetical protein